MQAISGRQRGAEEGGYWILMGEREVDWKATRLSM